MANSGPSDTSVVARLYRPGEWFELESVSANSLIVKGKLSHRGPYTLRIDIDGCVVSKTVRATGIEYDAGKSHSAVTIDSDSAISRLFEMVNDPARQPSELAPLIALMGEDRRASARSIPRPKGMAAVVAVIVAAMVCTTAAYFRFGVTHLRASLQAESVELARADHSGIFYPYATGGNHLLSEGELVGAVANIESRSFGVSAPCRCYLGDYPVSPGAFVTAGMPVARLYRPESPILISARVAPDSTWKLSPGAPVDIVVSGQIYQGHIASIDIERREQANPGADLDVAAIVQVLPDEEIDRTLLGGEAEIRVSWLSGMATRWLAALTGPSAT